jgi:hypothetical protein
MTKRERDFMLFGNWQQSQFYLIEFVQMKINQLLCNKSEDGQTPMMSQIKINGKSVTTNNIYSMLRTTQFNLECSVMPSQTYKMA